ncbi:unnamed protein product [Orchesella dallaii]|uniref:Uncharacterized protein n=1 Tax=Orchesella dallaii TaxID=48710 RepID=A0ABP1S7X4_9HEXA
MNSFSGNGNEIGLLNTRQDLQHIVSQIRTGNWSNIPLSLSEWQKGQLGNLEEQGISCLVNMWFMARNRNVMSTDTHCNATWDNVYCWPATPNGETISRPCSEILEKTEPSIAHNIQGNAFRVCLDNGTWLRGNWTNYTECADSYEEYVSVAAEEKTLVVAVQHLLFGGSIISLFCLAIALFIFFYFKCLRCDRVTVHIHLMLALLLRSVTLIVITEPFVLKRTSHYRNVDWVCKTVLSLNLYAAVASINWMFVQGIYLHGRLTTNVFDREAPFKVYYTIGWIIPFFLIGIYAATMETVHNVQCWKNYSERYEIWILLGPIIFALLANLIFLINIMRILLTKGQRANTSSDGDQFLRAVKATFVLFPLLGINNLPFLYNPGGEFNKYFVILNAVFGSTQGIFVTILYCFLCKDVKDAIGRTYRRFLARRSTNGIPRYQSPRDTAELPLLVYRSTTSYRYETAVETYANPPTKQTSVQDACV